MKSTEKKVTTIQLTKIDVQEALRAYIRSKPGHPIPPTEANIYWDITDYDDEDQGRVKGVNFTWNT